MSGKSSAERWKAACIRMIETNQIEGLRKVLERLDEHNVFMVERYEKEILDRGICGKNYEAVDVLLGHVRFDRLGSYVIGQAVKEDDLKLLDVALKYSRPNIPIHTCEWRSVEGLKGTNPDDHSTEGMNCYMTVEPLGLCAIRGKVDMARRILEQGARPEGCTVLDIMDQGRKNYYLRPVTNTSIRFLLQWDDDNHRYMEKNCDLKRLPPWACALYCDDSAAAEFFLTLGEDRSSLELSMAVSMVRSGEIIRILREKKPRLMAGVEPKHILRHYWPEAVKAYFSDGCHIPENAVQMMGTHMFEENNFLREQEKPVRTGLREADFIETLKFLLESGYRMNGEDVEYLTCVMMIFRSERLLHMLKRIIPRGMDVSRLIDFLPIEEKEWKFGAKLVEAGVKFSCKVDREFQIYRDKTYFQLVRLFKLVDFENCAPEHLDSMSVAAIMSRSKKAVALMWKHGFINRQNLSQAVKLICDLQIAELYEFAAELAGTAGGSEVRYEL